MNQDVKTIRKTQIFILLQYMTALLVIFFLTTAFSPAAEFLKNLLFYILIFILPVCLFIGIVYKERVISYLRFQLNFKAIITGLVIGLVMMAIFLVSNQFKFHVSEMDAARILALTGGMLAGLFEETVFRGFYLKFFDSRFGFVWANIFTSCLFTLLHIRQIIEQGIAQLAVLFVFSLFLGYACEKAKSLWVPVIIHIIFNVLIFILR